MFEHDGLSFITWVTGPFRSRRKNDREAQEQAIKRYEDNKKKLIRKTGKNGFEISWSYFQDDEIPQHQLLVDLGVLSFEVHGNCEIRDFHALILNPRSPVGIMTYFRRLKYARGYAASRSFKGYKIVALKVIAHPGE